MTLEEISKPEPRVFFPDLSHPNRIAIVSLLGQQDMKISQIAKKMNKSIPAIQKHLDKLIHSDLVTKNGNNEITLTTLGEAVRLQLPTFDFLYNNKEFFKTHSLSYLPEEFVKRIGDLNDSKAVTGYVSTIQECKILCEGAEKFAKFLAASVSLDVYGNHFPKLRDMGIKIRYIMGQNAIIPKGWLKLTKEVGEEEMIQRGQLERKMIKKMPVEMLVTDKSAFFIFPDNSGTADQSTMFVAGDESFRKWCDELFEYYWARSSSFLESKIREV